MCDAIAAQPSADQLGLYFKRLDPHERLRVEAEELQRILAERMKDVLGTFVNRRAGGRSAIQKAVIDVLRRQQVDLHAAEPGLPLNVFLGNAPPKILIPIDIEHMTAKELEMVAVPGQPGVYSTSVIIKEDVHDPSVLKVEV